MLRILTVAALIALPGAALAQTGTPPERIRNVQLPKGQTCPKAAPGEVVVCSTLEDPYRIPRKLRDDGPIPARSQSWVNRAATADEVGRVAGGLPNTCSTVGTGGQTGCSQAYARAWAADRRARRSGDGSGSVAQ